MVRFSCTASGPLHQHLSAKNSHFWIPLLYVAIGLLTVGLLFLPCCLPTPFVQGWDIWYHLDVTKAMVESKEVLTSIHYDFYSISRASITQEPRASGLSFRLEHALLLTSWLVS